MRIEDEIKQKSFTSEYQKLFINILFTSSWLKANHNKQLKPYGLSTEQYNILRILRGQKKTPASINLITERMIDKSSNVSRLVDKLLLKGYIEKRQNKTDKRQAEIIISDKGLETLIVLDEIVGGSENIPNIISIDETKRMNDCLDTLREHNFNPIK
jgi:DNA-binding MarR family transcriptional regulator